MWFSGTITGWQGRGCEVEELVWSCKNCPEHDGTHVIFQLKAVFDHLLLIFLILWSPWLSNCRRKLLMWTRPTNGNPTSRRPWPTTRRRRCPHLCPWIVELSYFIKNPSPGSYSPFTKNSPQQEGGNNSAEEENESDRSKSEVHDEDEDEESGEVTSSPFYLFCPLCWHFPP